METQDIEITCIDCSEKFVWTAGEQDFMQKLVDDLTNLSVKRMVPPKRCKECRDKRKSLFTKPN